MKPRLIIAAFAMAVVTSVFAPVVAANSGDSSWKDWKPTYRSERDLIAIESDSYIKYLHERGVPVGFTATQYGAARAEEEIRHLRRDYNLGPDFTSDELAANAGAKRVAEIMKYLGLSTHFTSVELRAAKVREDMRWTIERVPGLKFPFSADEYAKARGQEEADRLARQYGLSPEWVYPELVTMAGPSRAAEIRGQSGFARDASHEAIAQSLGKSSLKWFAEERGLPLDFTATDLVEMKSPKFWQYSSFAELPEFFTDADLVAYEGRKTLERIKRTYDMGGAFTEAQLRAAIAQKAIADMMSLYDLDANFTEADVRRAAGLSKAAETRIYYKLRRGFTAAEYEAAAKSRVSLCASGLYYEGCY